MGDNKDDVRQSPTMYGVNHQQGYGSSLGQQLAVRSATYSQSVGNQYDVKEEEEEEGDYEDDDEQNNGVKDVVGSEDDDSDEEEDEDDHNDKPKGYDDRKVEYVDLAGQQKKRKMKSLISSYEFAPRVPLPSPQPLTSTPSVPKPSSGGRNSLTDWTERETLALLDAWGDRFLQRGRKSLRFEEWKEVVNKVAEVSKIERTDTQCRNRLDTLKKKYKKEKTGAGASKWIYFKKMDMLISSPPQQTSISCELDSGGYGIVNPRVYLNRANGLNEVKNSPDDSESTEGDNDSDGLPPKKRKSGRDNDEGSPVRLLADCIHKFSAMYEKVESSKREQMVELEKMRMDFLRDVEMQKRQIMENAKAEIAKLHQRRNEDGNDNTSG